MCLPRSSEPTARSSGLPMSVQLVSATQCRPAQLELFVAAPIVLDVSAQNLKSQASLAFWRDVFAGSLNPQVGFVSQH